MPYRLHVLINTDKGEYEHTVPIEFRNAYQLAKMIERGLKVGEGVITSTVLTITYKPELKPNANNL